MPSLVKNPEMTPEKQAANQANCSQPQGPATPEGAGRCRDVAARHGFYSKRSGEALRVLGEDPAELEQLLESLRATWSAIAPGGERAGTAFRMEETSFRQITKFTGLLLRIKATEEAGREDAKKSENEGGSHDIIDNKGSASGTHDVHGAPRNIFCPEAAGCWDSLVAGVNPIVRKKLKNEAGMFMIINDFYFWNRTKAGMLMKTNELSKKAGMLLINKDVISFPNFDFRIYY